MIRLDNASAALVPGTLFAVSAWYHMRLPVAALPEVIAKILLYMLCYILSFAFSNEIAGVEEDRVNKPHRPIVTGELSMRSARWHLRTLTVVYLGVAWWLHVTEWALLWIVTTFLHDRLRFSRHWVLKDLGMFLGTLSMLAAAWEIVAPVPADGWRWIITISCVVFVLIPLQDLRDTAGDIRIGRRTFPIAFGERPTRLFLAAGFTALPVVVHLVLLAPHGPTSAGLVFGTAMAALNWLTAYRVVALRDVKADHLTYLLFCWWYCLATGASGPAMG
ncbi:UbiA family prenyltransferase [Streptomyces sp. NPDC048623]|uniref:UbiA family prenyltransferase n=1 Tax=Streptomyces sp. NPDC048623 TaxID=3155761 RepID=UPI00343B32D9